MAELFTISSKQDGGLAVWQIMHPELLSFIEYCLIDLSRPRQCYVVMLLYCSWTTHGDGQNDMNVKEKNNTESSSTY